MYFVSSPVQSKSQPRATAPISPPSYDTIVLDPNGPRSQTNLFIRKLASAVTEGDLQLLFESFGTVTSFALMRDIHTGESLGTAFVRFETHDQARKAMTTLDGTELYSRSISIQWAKKQHDGTPIGDARKKIHKLFVRNIPLDITSRQLRQLFSPYGAINNVTIHTDSAALPPTEGVPPAPQRNIAFILFHEDGAAEMAVRALHNTCPFPTCEGIPLMVKLAEDNRQRLKRRQKLDQQYNLLDSSCTPKLTAASENHPISPPTAVLPPATSPFTASLSPSSSNITGYLYAPQQNPYMMYTASTNASTPTAPAAYIDATNYATIAATAAAQAAYRQCFHATMSPFCMGLSMDGNSPPVVPPSLLLPQQGVVYSLPNHSALSPGTTAAATTPPTASLAGTSQQSMSNILPPSQSYPFMSSITPISSPFQLGLSAIASTSSTVEAPQQHPSFPDVDTAIGSGREASTTAEQHILPAVMCYRPTEGLDNNAPFAAKKNVVKLTTLTKSFMNDHQTTMPNEKEFIDLYHSGMHGIEKTQNRNDAFLPAALNTI